MKRIKADKKKIGEDKKANKKEKLLYISSLLSVLTLL